MSSFHYDFILSKRSSLAKVWLAAHWEKKLSKVQIFETNLQSIVQDILHPKTPIALRMSSHLLVGLVRIYSRKAKYLLKDCSDTLVNIKVSFRPGVSSLDKAVKQKKSRKEIMDCPLFITEKVDLLDQWNIPEVCNVELDCTLNQSKLEEITLQEEPMKVNSLQDYFVDEGFGEMDVDSTNAAEKTLSSCASVMERGYSFADSAYGTDDVMHGETTSLTDYYSDPFSSGFTPVKDVESSPSKRANDMPRVLLNFDDEENDDQNKTEEHREAVVDESVGEDTFLLKLDLSSQESKEENGLKSSFDGKPEDVQNNMAKDSHLGVQNERNVKRSFEELDDILVLEPVKITPKKVQSPRKRLKRNLLIDEVISIEREVIFDNLNNPSQLLKPPVFSSSTKREMKQNERNHSLLSKGSFFELSPALDRLFLNSKSRKFSTISDNSSESLIQDTKNCQNASETSFENNESLFANLNGTQHKPDEIDISEQFIPLQDGEYSSDEESPIGDKTRTAFDFDTEDQLEDTLVDENITKDKFCSLVETTVLQSNPEAVSFRQVVDSDGKKLTRKTVARRFLKCLLMQRDSRLTLAQEKSFGKILLHPGAKHVSDKSRKN